ncbi:MAG: peptidoglycan-binding domain-containing protein [Rhodospirillales bacterium]|nr:peptidoglycan-binding domain-containing protein [Rhodospirillales bacterium]
MSRHVASLGRRANGPVGCGERERDRSLDAVNLVIEIQRCLKQFGLYDLDIDGINGPKTQAGIRLAEKHYGLQVDGRPSLVLLKALESEAQAQREGVSNRQNWVDAIIRATKNIKGHFKQ